jgi:hypothetical protein
VAKNKDDGRERRLRMKFIKRDSNEADMMLQVKMTPEGLHSVTVTTAEKKSFEMSYLIANHYTSQDTETDQHRQ